MEGGYRCPIRGGITSPFNCRFLLIPIGLDSPHNQGLRAQPLLHPTTNVNTIKVLASCPWGLATAHGVGLLTEMYVIYMETCTSHRTISLGFFHIWPLASHPGNLPIVSEPLTGTPLLFCNIWQAAKNSWHAANSTQPDPPRSSMYPD